MSRSNVSYGAGSWDTITRNGIVYHRFRKMYNGERKEFTGRTINIVQEKVKRFEAHPLIRSQIFTLNMLFTDYMYDCALYFSTIKREPEPQPNSSQKDAIRHVIKSDSLLAKAKLKDVEATIITDFLIKMNEKNYARSTINTDLCFIKRCLERAKRDDLIKMNPGDSVAALREEEVHKKTKVVKPLELDDIHKLLEEAKRVNSPECIINGSVNEPVYGICADVICFLLFTGLRVNEATALKWGDLIYFDGRYKFINVKYSLKETSEKDEDGKNIRIRKNPKTRCSVRLVGINDNAHQIIMKQAKRYLDSTPNPDDFLFVTKKGSSVMYRNVNRTLKCMLYRANCKNQDATTHALRHSFGSYLISNGAEIYSVSKILGHSSITVTEKVYAELLMDYNISTVKLFDQLHW